MNRLCFKYLTLCFSLLLMNCENLPDLKINPTGKTNSPVTSFEPIPVQYPFIYKDSSIVENYHGKIVVDPFRWLEDDHSVETRKWVNVQNQLTNGYLDQIPFRDALKDRLQKIWNYERYDTPIKKENHYYYLKNDGLQNQSVLYVQKDLYQLPKIVLDPNTFSADGTTALGSYRFSKDGQFLAYQISEGGSDWQNIYIMDLSKGERLPEVLNWVKFSEISWFKNGFFYSRYPQPGDQSMLSGKNEFHQVYYHELGTSQSEDELIFADRAHPNRGFYAQTTSDERFLFIQVWESTSGNALYYRDQLMPDKGFVTLVESFEHDFTLVDNIDNNLLILTNYKADNNRLISINSKNPSRRFWEEILPEQDHKLENVYLIGGKIVGHYIENASSKIKIFDLKGKEDHLLVLPGIGTVQNITGQINDMEAFYSFATFTAPPAIYRLDFTTMTSTVFKTPDIDFHTDDYVTHQVWFSSYDNTKIPMFITHKRGLKLDGVRPTLMYGYGGFDISILPQFNLTRLNLGPVFLENNGVYAVVNLRGGGEFGKKWHQSGTKNKKQNVFNDFQAAAEYLIDNNYTSSRKLAIYGRSNGGLLIGACMTQRPDLFAVALPAVGVMDMLRYDKFTIGRAWATDYGLSENPNEFDNLISYSPLHNIVPAKYPATLVTTADHDDRVVPAHSFKFISTLQPNQKDNKPVLIRVESSAGHGAGKSTSKKIEEATDILGFTFYNLKENIVYEKQIAQ